MANYPEAPDMVRWIEGTWEYRNPTDPAYDTACSDDRLWMLTCQGARAEENRWGVRRNREGDVLRSLFRMGQYTWTGPQTLDASGIRSLWYTAAVGQEILAIVEDVDVRVSV